MRWAGEGDGEGKETGRGRGAKWNMFIYSRAYLCDGTQNEVIAPASVSSCEIELFKLLIEIH